MTHVFDFRFFSVVDFFWIFRGGVADYEQILSTFFLAQMSKWPRFIRFGAQFGIRTSRPLWINGTESAPSKRREKNGPFSDADWAFRVYQICCMYRMHVNLFHILGSQRLVNGFPGLPNHVFLLTGLWCLKRIVMSVESLFMLLHLILDRSENHDV